MSSIFIILGIAAFCIAHRYSSIETTAMAAAGVKSREGQSLIWKSETIQTESLPAIDCRWTTHKKKGRPAQPACLNRPALALLFARDQLFIVNELPVY
jgi:hypothetical protein